MFEYNINKNADNKSFKNACEKIENNIEGIKKDTPIIDVDGSIVQCYKKEEKNIKVFNDYEVDAVYIDSEIDLGQLFD